MKTLFYLFTIILLPTFLQAQKVIINEGFESTCNKPWKAFDENCIPNWISVSGTPDTKSDYVNMQAFQGNKFVHTYLWNKSSKCSQDNGHRGEGIALSNAFKKGTTYSLSFAIAGQASSLDWVLTSDMPNQSANPDGCQPEELIPSIKAGSSIVFAIQKAFNYTNWQYFENIEFTPEQDFEQLWFRPLDNGLQENSNPSQVFLDAVKIEELCFNVDDLIISKMLSSCPAQNLSGHITLKSTPSINWTLPTENSAVEIKNEEELRLINLGPSNYTLNVDNDNCSFEKTFLVTEDCSKDVEIKINNQEGHQENSLSELTPIIFPNPNNGNMTIELKAPSALTVSIEVFDNKGALIKSFDPTQAPSGNFQKVWNAAEKIPAGVYHFYFQTNFGIYQQKIVVSPKK